MKPLLISIAAALSVATGLAQTTQPPAKTRLEWPTFQVLGERYTSVRANLIKVAEMMPDADYAFRPTPQMETFATRIVHTAVFNFDRCSYLVGKPDPHKGESLERTVTKKTEAVALLKESFAFCDSYMNRLSRAAMAETLPVPHPSNPSITFDVELGGGAINAITHNIEMYGYLAVYLRLKGLIPPTSEPERSGRGAKS